MTIGEIISSARKKEKLTQDKLSKICGLSRSYLSDIEKDRYTPSVRSITSLAKVLKIDLNFLTEMTEIQDKKSGRWKEKTV